MSTQVSGARKSVAHASAYIADARVKLQQVPLNVSPSIKGIADDLTNADVDLKSSDAKLAAAETTITAKQTEINAVTDVANKKTAEAAYWKAKDAKSLGIIWRYRAIGVGIALLIAGYLALKFKWLALPFAGI